MLQISIHVPLAGNVLANFPAVGCVIIQISIHVPLAGNVSFMSLYVRPQLEFLSTFPLRGTSQLLRNSELLQSHFYPRSPCGERRGDGYEYNGFSIIISIHVPLAGNVEPVITNSTVKIHFYPRSPCGERLVPGSRLSPSLLFLSTFPLRGTSFSKLSLMMFCDNFYPRSPCGERLMMFCDRIVTRRYFYPRSPCGERRLWPAEQGRGQNISIHVPLAGNVARHLALDSVTDVNFYPRSPCGERLCAATTCARPCPHFYPRSPCGERPVHVSRTKSRRD